MLDVILDMDGVIADFTGGLCREFGIDYDVNNYPFPRGLWDYVSYFERVHKLEWSDVAKACSNPDFWRTLTMLPGAQVLYTILCDNHRASFMTTATGDIDANFTGKRRWLEFYDFAKPHDKRMMCLESTESKAQFAAPDRVLLDDKDANVQEFIKAGGHAILVPRPWNNRHNEFTGYEQANICVLRDLARLEARVCI